MEVTMEALCFHGYFHGSTAVLLQERSCGAYIGLPWNFHGAPMVLALFSHATFVVLGWNFHKHAARVALCAQGDFHGASVELSFRGDFMVWCFKGSRENAIILYTIRPSHPK